MREDSVDFSIVTPSLNMLGYLKRCCASVADQEGVSVEHIVMDGGSTDGTVEWLAQRHGITGIIQQDEGMYDAINKGLERARGRFVAYLNCDEQYLPGTLDFVKKHFERYPDVDVLFGDALLIRPDGMLIAYRKGYPLRWFYVLASHLYALSCTMFFRRKLVEEGLRFDARLKDAGDMEFVVRMLRRGYKVRHIARYLAAFTITGKNMSTHPRALEERRRLVQSAPTWVRVLRPFLNLARLTEKFFHGAYWQTMPLEYAVYVSDETEKRKVFRVMEASFRWPGGEGCNCFIR